MKRSIDTNVLARALIVDDSDQAEAAAALVVAGNVFVAATVLLETEWVLRGALGLNKESLVRLLGMVMDFPGVEVERRELALRALDAFAAGMDFADAMHLYSSDSCTEFVTFDRKLAKRAGAESTTLPVRLLDRTHQQESNR